MRMNFKMKALGIKPPKSAGAVDYESKELAEFYRQALIEVAKCLDGREPTFYEGKKIAKMASISAGEIDG